MKPGRLRRSADGVESATGRAVSESRFEQGVPEDFRGPLALPADAEQAARWQAANHWWWEAHPMRYDWRESIQAPARTCEFYQEIDRRLLASVRVYMPWRRIPFDPLIDFAALAAQDVLEIGVGQGVHAQLLAARARSYTGIDLTEAAIQATAERLECFGLRADLRRMDGEALDFADQSFDLVWSWGVVHHSADPRRILSEIGRVLKDGGRCTTMVYHRSLWFYYLIRGLMPALFGGHVLRGRTLEAVVQASTDGAIARYYTIPEWRALVSEFLELEDVRVYGQKSELLPLPGGWLKDSMTRAVPDRLSRWFTNELRQGSFLVSTQRKKARRNSRRRRCNNAEPLTLGLLRNCDERGSWSMKLYADHIAAGVAGQDFQVINVECPGGDRARRLQSKLSRLWQVQVAHPRRLRDLQADLYHIVDHANAHWLASLKPERTIVTCHDLILMLLSRGKIPRRGRRPLLASALFARGVSFLRRAAAVICVSESTQRDLLEQLGCEASRLVVIPQGVDQRFRRLDPHELEQDRRRLGLTWPVLLVHVGNPMFYKNVEGLIEALALLPAPWKARVHLGKVGFDLTPEQRELVDRRGLSGRVHYLGRLDIEDLIRVYNLADAVVHPSFYEGFGWPPLEAMACGTPVVCSDRGALAEVVGDAARIVDPEDPKAIARAIVELLEDVGLRRELIVRGLARATTFSWDRAIRKTTAVYHAVLEQRAPAEVVRDERFAAADEGSTSG
jgi:glycosyltransferase involved in cell wall biosynthesis/SAM-dependent methyltransferase